MSKDLFSSSILFQRSYINLPTFLRLISCWKFLEVTNKFKMKILIYAFLLLSATSALVSAGFIGYHAPNTARAGEIAFVVQLLELIGNQFGLNSAGGSSQGHLSNDEAAAIVASLYSNSRHGQSRNHLSNEEIAAIVASLNGNRHGHHVQSHRGLSSADTAAIVASLYASEHGHRSHTSSSSHDIIPAVVAGLYASGYGHKTHAAGQSAVVSASSQSGSHGVAHSGSHSGGQSEGYHYGHKTK